jgi:hypothetical protein
MSEENVEVVRGHIEAFRQGDAPGKIARVTAFLTEKEALEAAGLSD